MDLTADDRPDAKTQRYDRQLRLWAASGQAALESAHVLVVSGSALATSTLKNLVLPGVGSFTILDDAKVTPEDLGNNFFLQPGETKVGDLRAKEAMKYLSELNEGVKASFIDKVSLVSFPCYTSIHADLASSPSRNFLKAIQSRWHPIPLLSALARRQPRHSHCPMRVGRPEYQ